jgi:hypothetical protein
MKRFSLLIAMSLAGCGGPTLVDAGRLKKAVVDMPMVARKRSTPVVLVLTESSVPQTIEVRDDGKPRVLLHDLAGWLGSQLKESLGQIYENVSVAKSEKEVPRERHLEVHVLVKRFMLEHVLGGWGNIICSQAKLTWAIGLRMSGDTEYAFSSTGTESGDCGSFKEAVNDTLIRAVQDFSTSYVNGQLGERVEAGEKLDSPKKSAGETAL